MGNLRNKIFTLFFSILFCCSAFQIKAQGPEWQYKFYQAKTVFIYGFTRYFEWPNISQNKTFRIGVIGADDNLILELNKLAKAKKAFGLPIEIIVLDNNYDGKLFPNLEVLYVNFKKFGEVKVSNVQKNTLLIADTKQEEESWESNPLDFDKAIITFLNIGGKLKFAYNLWLANKSGLKLNEDFKKLAAANIDGNNSENFYDEFTPSKIESAKTNSTTIKVNLKSNDEDANSAPINTNANNNSEKLNTNSVITSSNESKVIAKNNIVQKDWDNAIDKILGNLEDVTFTKEELREVASKLTEQKSDLELKVEALSAQQKRLEQQKKVFKIQNENILLHQSQLKTQLEKNKAQRNVIWLSLIAGIAVLISLILVYRNFSKTKKTNAILEIQKAEIQIQKNVIEEKHREISDSINYAERIQRSFLPNEKVLNASLGEHFIFFKPKDVVSGDFYWVHQFENGKTLLATADSTGHGVPGAIMSLINISSLEKSIESIVEPSDVLNYSRKLIIERLKKDGSQEGGKDGMDCSLVLFDFKNKKIFQSAANNPVLVVKKLMNGNINSDLSKSTIINEKNKCILFELDYDSMPVGKHDRDSISFSQMEVDLEVGDMVYALTDGMPDQFGGEKGKKFMYKKLKELLVSIAHLEVSEQKATLDKVFSDWKGDNEQVDDVTIVGVRI